MKKNNFVFFFTAFFLLSVMIISTSCNTPGGTGHPSSSATEKKPPEAQTPSPASSDKKTPVEPAEESPEKTHTSDTGAIITDGLLVYWSLDEGEGNTIKDQATGQTAELMNCRWVDGIRGKALELNGTNGKLISGLKINQAEGTNGATFCLWVNPASHSEGRHQVISFDNGDYDWSILQEDDYWCVFTGDNSENTDFTADVDQWQFICGVFNPGEGKILFYKNDREKEIPFISTEEDTNTLGMGDNPSDEYEEYFEGKIDEIRIYDRPLSKNEVLSIYNRTKK